MIEPPSSFADAAADAGVALSDGSVTSDAAALDATASNVDVGADAAAGACFTDTGDVRPALKTCETSSDCTVVLLHVSCCGSETYVGVSTSNATRLEGCDTARVASFPKCGCGSGPPTTEDGTKLMWGTSPASVPVTCLVQPNAAIGVCTTAKS
jgi:hypothetical protein